MSALDNLTEADVKHLDDPMWREIVRCLGDIPGRRIAWMLMLTNVPLALKSPAIPSDHDILRTLENIKAEYDHPYSDTDSEIW